MFDIRDIEIVQSVVEHGGFRAAAARLRLSQSAVSARVAALEERLGMELLDRRKRRGRLTPAGRSFLEQAARLTEMRDGATVDDVTAVTTAPVVVTLEESHVG